MVDLIPLYYVQLTSCDVGKRQHDCTHLRLQPLANTFLVVDDCIKRLKPKHAARGFAQCHEEQHALPSGLR